jgi:hypothetical protein
MADNKSEKIEQIFEKIEQEMENEQKLLFITGAQDFQSDKAFVSVNFRRLAGTKYANQKFLVTSDKQKIILDEDELLKHLIVIDREPYLYKENWQEANLNQFLKGVPAPIFKNILENIVRESKAAIDFTDQRWHEFVALWIMGTYFHRQFTSYPYIHLNGHPGSGKTKCLTLISILGFNGELSINNTPSYMIRVVHNNHATCCIDEVEKLNKAKDEDSQTILAMLNAGYKRGSFVGKSEQRSGKSGKWEPVRFEAYSPKVLAGIQNLPHSLTTRCVPIVMLKSNNKNVVNQEIDEQDTLWQGIKNQLHWCMLEEYQNVYREYVTLKDVDILGRSWELWKPILALARVVSHEMYEQMRLLALEIEVRKKDLETENLITPTLLKALYLLVEEHAEAQNKFFTTIDIYEHLARYDDETFGWLTKDENKYKRGRWLGKELRISGLVQGKAFQKRIGDTNLKGYKLNFSLIKKLMETYGIKTDKEENLSLA